MHSRPPEGPPRPRGGRCPRANSRPREGDVRGAYSMMRNPTIPACCWGIAAAVVVGAGEGVGVALEGLRREGRNHEVRLAELDVVFAV